MNRAGAVTDLYGDHLGSTSVTTGAGGNVKRQTYYPYGTVRTTDGLPTDYTFTGQKLDERAALMYYGARYYDAAIGRFIQPDSLIPDPYNPQSLNRYSYTLNNPVRYTDPTGHRICEEEDCNETEVDLPQPDFSETADNNRVTEDNPAIDLGRLLDYVIPTHGGLRANFSFGGGAPLWFQPEIGVGPNFTVRVQALCNRVSLECGGGFGIDVDVNAQNPGLGADVTAGVEVGWGASTVAPLLKGYSAGGGYVACAFLCAEEAMSMPLTSAPVGLPGGGSADLPAGLYVDPKYGVTPITDYFGGGFGGSLPFLQRASGGVGGGIGYTIGDAAPMRDIANHLRW